MSSLYDHLNKQLEPLDGKMEETPSVASSSTPASPPIPFAQLQTQLDKSSDTTPSLNFDKLNQEIDEIDKKKVKNLTPLDIAELPEMQKKIMFALLRDRKASIEGISLAGMREKLNVEDDLMPTIEDLITEGWLMVFGEVPRERYKINLRFRRGSSLWSALSSRIFDALIKE